MNFKNQCVLCNAAENLNTLMKVSVDGETHEVAVCETCEDDASPKVVREALQKKVVAQKDVKNSIMSKMELLMKEAAAIGIDIGFLTPKEAKEPIREAKETIAKKRLIEEHGMTVPAPRPIVAPTSVGGQTLESYDPMPTNMPLQLKDGTFVKPPPEKTIQTQIYETESGRPIEIAKRKIGPGGETNIRITTYTDSELQRRAKGIAASEHSFNPKQGGSHLLNECSVCSGTGISKIGKKDCPRCGGSGYRS